MKMLMAAFVAAGAMFLGSTNTADAQYYHGGHPGYYGGTQYYGHQGFYGPRYYAPRTNIGFSYNRGFAPGWGNRGFVGSPYGWGGNRGFVGSPYGWGGNRFVQPRRGFSFSIIR